MSSDRPQLPVDDRFSLAEWLAAAQKGQTPDGLQATVVHLPLYKAGELIMWAKTPMGVEYRRCYAVDTSILYNNHGDANGYGLDDRGWPRRYAGFAATQVAAVYEHRKAVPETDISEQHTVYVYGREQDIAEIIATLIPRRPAEHAHDPRLVRIEAAMGKISVLAGAGTLIWEELVPECEKVLRATAALQRGMLLLYAHDRDDVVGAPYLVNGDAVHFVIVGTEGGSHVVEMKNLHTGQVLKTIHAMTSVGNIEGTDLLCMPVEVVGATTIRPNRIMASYAAAWMAYVHALSRLESPREVDLVELDRQLDLVLKSIAW